jgi:hypothetical protein
MTLCSCRNIPRPRKWHVSARCGPIHLGRQADEGGCPSIRRGGLADQGNFPGAAFALERGGYGQQLLFFPGAGD